MLAGGFVWHARVLKHDLQVHEISYLPTNIRNGGWKDEQQATEYQKQNMLFCKIKLLYKE